MHSVVKACWNRQRHRPPTPCDSLERRWIASRPPIVQPFGRFSIETCQRRYVTIYNGALEDRDFALRARVALMMFNDVILRVAFEHHASVIDLRLVCNEKADYANPIEPSGQGGLKIAKAIVRAGGVLPGEHFSATFC